VLGRVRRRHRRYLLPSADRTCGYISFFTSAQAARTWADQHPAITGAVLTQAQALSQGIAEFGALLRTRDSTSQPTGRWSVRKIARSAYLSHDGCDVRGTRTATVAGQELTPAASAGPAGTGRGRERTGLGGLWLLLAPLACCGAPLLLAGLAAAGLLTWGGLGLAIAVPLAGAVLIIRRRRCTCQVPAVTGSPDETTTTRGLPAR
jgi:hypothetical protein